MTCLIITKMNVFKSQITSWNILFGTFFISFYTSQWKSNGAERRWEFLDFPFNLSKYHSSTTTTKILVYPLACSWINIQVGWTLMKDCTLSLKVTSIQKTKLGVISWTNLFVEQQHFAGSTWTHHPWKCVWWTTFWRLSQGTKGCIERRLKIQCGLVLE